MSNVNGEGPTSPEPVPSESGPAAPAKTHPTGPPTGPPKGPPPSAPPTHEPRDSEARRRWRRTAKSQEKGQEKPRSKLPSVAATTAVTAAITAVVGGVLSQDRIDGFFSGDEPSESSSAPESPSAEVELDYKQVTDSTRSVAVDVPSAWGVIDDGFTGIDGVASPGLALRAGPDPNAFRIQSNETAYVGASAQALDDLGLAGLDDAAVERLLKARRESVAFLPQAGCTPTSDHTPELGEDWVGAAQAWQECSSLAGWRAIEVEMVSTARDVYVFIQIGLPAATPDEVAQRLLDSLDVLTVNLPVS